MALRKVWDWKYFVRENKNKPICLICNETVAVMKEYNIKRHYVTKHASTYEKFEGQVRKDKFQNLKKSIKAQQSVFRRASRDTLSNVKLSLKISEAIGKSCRPFSDGEFIKDCIGIFVDKMCPEKRNSLENTSLSCPTITRRIEDLSQDIENAVEMKISQCKFYSIVLDESNVISDAAQLSVFIRGVANNFEVIEELLEMCSMKGTTTRQHIVDEVKKVFEKFKIDPKKFCGITTDEAAAMTGKIKGFIKLFIDELGVKKPDIVVNCCIIHQDNLCSKVLRFEDIMKKVVQSVNFIRSRALNHRHFKAMVDEFDSKYGDRV